MTLVTSTLATFATSTLADESCVGDCVGEGGDFFVKSRVILVTSGVILETSDVIFL